MSRDEAIEILSDMRAEYNLFGDEKEATRYHVLSWAIKEMKALPQETHYKHIETHARDLISRNAAIDAFDGVKVDEGYCTECDIGYNDGIDLAVSILSVLPSAQPDLCEYCNEDADGFVTPLEKNGHAFVRFGVNGWELSLRANGWHGSAKIRYCPMCGRDLFVK